MGRKCKDTTLVQKKLCPEYIQALKKFEENRIVPVSDTVPNLEICGNISIFKNFFTKNHISEKNKYKQAGRRYYVKVDTKLVIFFKVLSNCDGVTKKIWIYRVYNYDNSIHGDYFKGDFETEFKENFIYSLVWCEKGYSQDDITSETLDIKEPVRENFELNTNIETVSEYRGHNNNYNTEPTQILKDYHLISEIFDSDLDVLFDEFRQLDQTFSLIENNFGKMENYDYVFDHII